MRIKSSVRTFLGSVVIIVLICLTIPSVVTAADGPANAEIELKYDTGEVICKAPSLYNDGYLVDFTTPNDQLIISKIRINGTVMPGSTRNDFDLEIWDSGNRTLFTKRFPISLFPVSPSVDWIELAIPDIAVTGRFYIHVFKGSMRSDTGVLLSASRTTEEGSHIITTKSNPNGNISLDKYWYHPSMIEKDRATWMVRVAGMSRGIIDLEDKSDYEFAECHQVMDFVSLQKAKQTWDLAVTNKSNITRSNVSLSVRSPVASLVVTRVTDKMGDLKFDYLVGQPILPGESREETIRIYFRQLLSKFDTLSLTLELDASASKQLEHASTICLTNRLFKKAKLSILAPPGYMINHATPEEANVRHDGGRDSVSIEAANVKELNLAADFILPPTPMSIVPQDQPASKNSGDTWPAVYIIVIVVLVAASLAFIGYFLIWKRRIVDWRRLKILFAPVATPVSDRRTSATARTVYTSETEQSTESHSDLIELAENLGDLPTAVHMRELTDRAKKDPYPRSKSTTTSPSADTAIRPRKQELSKAEPPITLLNNRYEVVKRLKLGGMAVIELAKDHQNGRLCVVKKPRTDTKHDIKINANKIAVEAAYLMQFDHPHIVKYIDLFSHDNVFHLVVDFIGGGDLLSGFNQVPAEETRALKWAGQILDALEYIHKCGVVHRDINPGNIMLRKSDDNVVIVDFGTIKPIAVDQWTEVSKPGFEVPEQVARGYSDEKSDLYGVGSVLFYVLTCKTPGSMGRSETIAEALAYRGVSEKMARCIEQSLQIDAQVRFNSASAMRKALGI